MRKALIAIVSVVAIAAFLLVGQDKTNAADHTDAPAVIAAGDADLADVFAWTKGGGGGGGGKLVLALTLNSGEKFSDAGQYVFHVARGTGIGATPTETIVLCEFDGAGVASCWLGAAGSGENFTSFVTGDASVEAGIESADENFKVFAGERNDPFFLNLTGLTEVITMVHGVAAGLDFNVAGCPTVPDATGDALVAQLATGVGGAAPVDTFLGLNVAALVVEVKQEALGGTGDILAVHASTRKKN